jgi:hypothetical protein
MISLVARDWLLVSGNILARGLSSGQAGADGQPGSPYRGPTDDGAAGDGGRGGKGGMDGSGKGGAGGVGGKDADGLHIDEIAGTGGGGGRGGAGSGGGLLLKAPIVTLTGTLDASGDSGPANGGTVKVFYSATGGLTNAGTVTAGRLSTKQQ